MDSSDEDGSHNNDSEGNNHVKSTSDSISLINKNGGSENGNQSILKDSKKNRPYFREWDIKACDVLPMEKVLNNQENNSVQRKSPDSRQFSLNVKYFQMGPFKNSDVSKAELSDEGLVINLTGF